LTSRSDHPPGWTDPRVAAGAGLLLGLGMGSLARAVALEAVVPVFVHGRLGWAALLMLAAAVALTWPATGTVRFRPNALLGQAALGLAGGCAGAGLVLFNANASAWAAVGLWLWSAHLAHARHEAAATPAPRPPPGPPTRP